MRGCRSYQEAPAAQSEPPAPSRQLTLVMAECASSLTSLAAMLAQPLAGPQQPRLGAHPGVCSQGLHTLSSVHLLSGEPWARVPC